MLKKRYYELELLPSSFFANIDFIIVGICKEERAAKVRDVAGANFTGTLITVEYDLESEKYLIHTDGAIKAEPTGKLDHHGKDLVPNLFDDLIKLGVVGKTVLVDSTSLVHPFLFYLIKVVKQESEFLNLPNFYVTYTEPKKYHQNKDKLTNRRFDLTEKFCNRNSIPGFLRPPSQGSEKTLVAIMGFEGNRSSSTYEEVNPAIYKTFAIVGFPSYQPSWQYYVYSQNKSVLELSKAHQNLHRVSAFDPFGVYNVLKKIYSTEHSNNVIIAPLGTKPHSIGACMFAIDYDTVQLFYDYPLLGKKIRTEGVGSSYLYNLSIFINE